MGRASGDQPSKVVERAELRVHGIVPALGRADGVGAARIVGRRSERIVAPFAVGAADRVDGREI